MADLPFRIVVKDDGTAVLQGFQRSVSKMRAAAARQSGLISRAFGGIATTLRRLPGLVFNLRTALVGLAAAAAIRKISDVFGKFQLEMNRVQVLTRSTEATMLSMTKQAEELGRTTQFSATEAGKGMSFLAKAGFEANEIMEALPRTLELAAAAQIDLGKAADIVTNILTGVGVPLAELAEANDILVETFTRTNTDLLQLGQAFKFVGPITQAAGVEFKEASAALGLLGNAGIQATLAGTALRGSIARLINPSKAASKVIEKLGLDVFISEGKISSLVDIIEQLERSGANTAEIMKIFGQRAGPGMAALLAQGSIALREMIVNLDNAGGRAKEVAEIQLRGLTGAIIRMKSAIDGMLISLGKEFAPVIAQAADDVKAFAVQMTAMFKAFRRARGETESVTKETKRFGSFLAAILPTAEAVINAFFRFQKIIVSVKIALDLLRNTFSILSNFILSGFVRPGIVAFKLFLETVGGMFFKLGEIVAGVFADMLEKTGKLIKGIGTLTELAPGFENLGAKIFNAGIQMKGAAAFIRVSANAELALKISLEKTNDALKNVDRSIKDNIESRKKAIRRIIENQKALAKLNREQKNVLAILKTVNKEMAISAITTDQWKQATVNATSALAQGIPVFGTVFAAALRTATLEQKKTLTETDLLRNGLTRLTLAGNAFTNFAKEAETIAGVRANFQSLAGLLVTGNIGNALGLITTNMLQGADAAELLKQKFIEIGGPEALAGIDAQLSLTQRIIDTYARLPEQMKASFTTAINEANNSVELINAIIKKGERDITQFRIKQANQALTNTASLFGSLATLAESSGRSGFERAKKFSIAQTLIDGLAGSISVFNTPGLDPFTKFAMSAAILATTFATIQKIRATQPGGGGGGGGGGVGGGGAGGGGGGGSGSTVNTEDAVSRPREFVINISIAEGFVGSPQELASALAPVIREAVGDGADFGLETRNG